MFLSVKACIVQDFTVGALQDYCFCETLPCFFLWNLVYYNISCNVSVKSCIVSFCEFLYITIFYRKKHCKISVSVKSYHASFCEILYITRFHRKKHRMISQKHCKIAKKEELQDFTAEGSQECTEGKHQDFIGSSI